MRMTRLFTKTRKEAPADEVSRNAQLLIRAGYINKELAGVYGYLPLGHTTLNKIIGIIREEMEALEATELHLTSLQDPEVWKQTDRWDDEKVDVWFKTHLKNGSELGLALTHEDPMTQMMKEHISSYRDLPRLVYQFQTKLRNETRAKSGIMRCREFIMKDLYSFARTEEEHEKIYESVAKAYTRIFERLGLGDRTYKTFASGGIFSKYSHEYQTVIPVGEDTVYLSKERGIAVNQEVYTDEVLENLKLAKDSLEEVQASEVGNIFTLGTRFSDALGLKYKDEKGQEKPVIMGSYGIGPGRVMGVLVETFADEKGIVWPEAVAPYRVHLASLGDDEAVKKAADELYQTLGEESVLYDDRDLRPGEKLGDADLLGMPTRIVVSTRSLEAGGVEVTDRATGASEIIPVEKVQKLIFEK